MDRRELLRKSGVVAGALVLSKIALGNDRKVIADCIPSQTRGPSPATTCMSCIQNGMAGVWPNCYYREYLNLNQNLCNATSLAHVQVAHAVLNRTITPSLYSAMLSYRRQLNAHLSVTQTTIHDKVRIQFAAPNLYTSPRSAWISAISNVASNNGFDPAAWGNAASNSGSLANVNNPPDPNLQNEILHLPDYQAMDQFQDAVLDDLESMTINPNGICFSMNINGPQWSQTGEKMMIAGGIIMAGSGDLGAASEPLQEIGQGLTMFGGMAWSVGEMCQW